MVSRHLLDIVQISLGYLQTYLSMLAVRHTAKHLTDMDDDFVIGILSLLVI
jgi:hypothetical protein